MLCLGAVAAFAVVHEVRKVAASPAAAAAMAAGGAYTGHQERPALSAAEESYAAGLWAIHSQVKATAVQMTFAGLSYKMGDIDRKAVKERVTPLIKVFRDARVQAAQLKAPPSMEAEQKKYLDALKRYEDASVEMVKVAHDGKDDHLVAAQKLSFAASEDLLRVGDALWPGEFKPN
ncbi:MAG TPA: hypothetical protein VEV20_08020 [Burkholderiales bacterium]|nr:hypothetical protein [Burkholderiales bacterium]